MKGQELISSSLRLIGVLASGENPTGAEGTDCLAILNDMIDSWNTEHLVIYTSPRVTFNLVSGTATYTYGTGGTFNAARPPRIERAGIIPDRNAANPLELPIEYTTDIARWSEVRIKSTQSSLPSLVFDDAGFPLRTLSFFPVPNVATVAAALYPWTAIAAFADLTTDYTFPPGYAKALRYNLSVDLAPEFGREVPAIVLQQAVQSKANIKSLNLLVPQLRCDPAMVGDGGGKGYYNWRTDE